MIHRSIAGACALALGLSACVVGFAQEAASSPAASRSEPPKIEMARMRSKVMPGDKLGTAEGGWLCIGKHETKASDQVERVFEMEGLLAFRKVAAALGLSVADRDISAFDTAGPSNADYRLGGVVISMEAATCSYPPENRKGTITVEVKWDLFSTHQQRVLVSKTTSGTITLDSFEAIAGREFEARAFAASMTNFFADAQVKQLMSGVEPPLPAVAVEPLHVKAGTLVAGGTTQNADSLRSAVVTIVADTGFGSGFYFAEGYLLTDWHVVHASRFVKVKLASGRELVGEVVRSDGPLDVALVKTEPAGVPQIRLRQSAPIIGEDVWAIGSPMSQQLAGTMTRGILSGTREDAGLHFLQSDVAVNPGNSGGPLLDGQSSVIGLTKMKYTDAAGLAFFVPIGDALARLGLNVDLAAPVEAPIASLPATSTPPAKATATAAAKRN